MPTQRPPAYPTTRDISYAMWLRHFAAILPHYTSHYGVAEEEVFTVQADAQKFTSWLIRRMHRATQAIQQPSSIITTPREEEAAVVATRLLLLKHAAKIVRHIRAHRKYSIIDGVKLKLKLCLDYQIFESLPAPQLCVVGHQVLDNSFAVALRWKAYPEAVIDLEVCRDGYTWHPSLLLTGECHADIHPQPAEPEQWQYRARYRRPDWPTGPWSQVATVELSQIVNI